ncbi:MAG: hypothetical protein Q4B54_13725, partial [Coriobacteriales bacterium]|nr:hypothetical protein [Coriobacteriales bacterium]
TIEEIYNDYQDLPESEKDTTTFDTFKKRALDFGLDDVTLTAQGNELIMTFLMPAESSAVYRHMLQQRLQAEEVRNEAAKRIEELGASLTDNKFNINGDISMRLVCQDTSGQEVGQAVYSRDGLVSYEGPDIILTLEDLFNDEKTAASRASLDSTAKSLEETIGQTFPGSRVWVEVHGNEVELIAQLNAQSDQVNLAAIDEDYRGEEMVSSVISDAQTTVNSLKDFGIDYISPSYRYTYRDAEGNVLATYLYNLDGLVEE